jgi:hypothetical protein
MGKDWNVENVKQRPLNTTEQKSLLKQLEVKEGLCKNKPGRDLQYNIQKLSTKDTTANPSTKQFKKVGYTDFWDKSSSDIVHSATQRIAEFHKEKRISDLIDKATTKQMKGKGAGAIIGQINKIDREEQKETIAIYKKYKAELERRLRRGGKRTRRRRKGKSKKKKYKRRCTKKKRRRRYKRK